jgi:hypothetical protein
MSSGLEAIYGIVADEYIVSGLQVLSGFKPVSSDQETAILGGEWITIDTCAGSPSSSWFLKKEWHGEAELFTLLFWWDQ